MSLTTEVLNRLNDHWLVSSISPQERDRAKEIVRERLAQDAVGRQITFSFKHGSEDEDLLDRMAFAYMLASVEGLGELSHSAGSIGESSNLRNQAIAGAYQAFEFRRLMQVPSGTLQRLYFILEGSAMAYCGSRWSDLGRWYKDHEEALHSPSVADAEWDQRVLYRLFDCWIRLFRKSGWDDLDRIREIISGLREDQKIYEKEFLGGDSEASKQSMALRLVALYHWAKGTELLALYMLQGESANPFGGIDKHFEAGIKAATAAKDAQLEVILRWLHAATRIMISNSLWWATRKVNSKTTSFVRELTHRSSRAMFELLPPQRAALLEQNLLDQAKTSIVVDIPTSGGKTLLAQFRMLQALNQFAEERGWVAYLAPTRALTAQITRRLRRDFEPIGLQVEQLTAAIDVDVFEEQLLADSGRPFHVLVATPEKLSLVIRNKKATRPLALVVMDEAQNLETEGRGLRMELLLATIRRDCPRANFLLLMPYAEEAGAIAQWLAEDSAAGHSISLGTTPWKPNERIVGLYKAVEDSGQGNWHLEYRTVSTSQDAMPLSGSHSVGKQNPLKVPRSKVLSGGKQTGLGIQTAAIATVMSQRGTSVAVGESIRTAWRMAREAAKVLPDLDPLPAEIGLVQDFLRSEISPDFLLVDTLSKGIGVHHAGLSDDVRSLMEWLAESGSLRVLCSTSTISQGINFPVSSIFLSSWKKPQRGRTVEMEPREFWNLAGRAGRLGQDSVGVVGLTEGTNPEETMRFLSRSTGALVSQLVKLLDDLANRGELLNLSGVLWQDQWEDFRSYIAHLWREHQDLEGFLADSEMLLRNTYGYFSLETDPARREKADALLNATKEYAQRLARLPRGMAELADATGFSPEGVGRVITGLRGLGTKITSSDLAPESLFGGGGRFADLFGVVLNVPQIKRQLQDISGKGFDHSRIADITRDWVNGDGIKNISLRYFKSDADDARNTVALTAACRAIYRSIVNSGTWGISAVTQISGIDIDSLPEPERRRINSIPAMIYHGVDTEDAVLMRMNSVPRSAAKGLGKLYRVESGESEERYSVSKARNFLQELGSDGWSRACPSDVPLSSEGYRKIWGILAGEQA